MRTTSSIQFYVRESKADRNGYAPLECSITICGERRFLNLPMKYRPQDFNSKKPPIEILEALDQWRSRINLYTTQMLKFGIALTPHNLRQIIREGGVKSYTVGRMLNDFLNIQRQRVGIEIKDTVYRKYELTAERVLEHISKDDDINKLTPQLVKKIELDWKTRFDISTACGYLTRFKAMTRFAQDNGKLEINPFVNTRIIKPEKPIKALNEGEVQQLLKLSLEPRLQRILDIFLIQCGTGMAYIDLLNFKAEDLKRIGDWYYISKERVKTGRTFTAVVLPFAIPIILHYQKLPVPTNQVYNRYLKEINSSLTSHMGRRTYATILYNRNASIETIASALGDNPTIALKYYAKIFPQTSINQQIKLLE